MISNVISQSSYLTMNKKITYELGHESAIILALLVEKAEKNNGTNEGFFDYTAKQIEEEIGFKRRALTKALNILQENNLIEVKIGGIPARKFFRINETGINNFLNQ